MNKLPGVSVVIPTVGRPELVRAIRSVHDQDYSGPIELIVVGDLPEGALRVSETEGVDRILYTGGGRRGGAARNAGILAATQEYVAFLDDDDEWFPWKLRNQIVAFQDDSVGVVGTRCIYRNAETGSESDPVPTVPKQAEEPVIEYLFRRRKPTTGRAVIFTSTLVARTELAQRVQWDETLSRHQDWDWLDRLERAGARIAQIADPSTAVWTGSAGSISSSGDWRASLAWAESRRGIWVSQTLADFLAGQSLRYALQSRSPEGVRKVGAAILKCGRFPSPSTIIVGFGGLVPRQLINRLLAK